MVKVKYPAQAYNPLGAIPLSLELPRPLWQLEEELAAHLNSGRPPVTRYQELQDWIAKRDAIQMWIDYANSGFGVWKDNTPHHTKLD
jgi:hypothetical protein